MTTVGSGQTSAISSSQLSSGWIVQSGGTLNVLSGGIASDSVLSGGILNVSASGTADATYISSGQQNVYGLASDTVATEDGSEVIYSGGTASATTLVLYANQYVSSGGTAVATVVDDGNQTIFVGGIASGAAISEGNQYISSGGLADGTTVSSSGYQYVEFGGTASGTIIGSAGYEYVDAGGTANAATISGGGILVLDDGGSLGGGAVTFAGASATLELDTASMPGNVISGFAPTDVIDLAALSFAGGSVVLSSGNELQVSLNGSSYDLQFDPSQNFSGDAFYLAPDIDGNTDVLLGREATVSAGLTISDTLVSAGTAQIVYGTATYASIEAGGAQIVASGGAASGTTISAGGYAEVAAGGTDNDATINYGGVQVVFGSASFAVADSGEQDVYGTASGTTLSHGYQDVFSGGLAEDTIVGGYGEQDIEAGGTASGTTLNEGYQDIYSGGLADGTTVGGDGDQDVDSGGTASGTIVGSGGYEYVGGTAIGTTISGGTLELYDGGSLGSGAVTFAGMSGTLEIDTASMPGSVIGGFAPTDVIDLAALSFAGGSVVLSSGNELQVSLNGSSYDLQFDPSQNFSGDAFYLAPDIHGNTDVLLGQEATVSAGLTISGALVSAGTAQVVYGTAVSTTIEAGGAQIVESGGATSVTTISDSGYAEVAAGGTDSYATINYGGVQVVFGSAISAIADGGEQDVYGTANSAELNDADQNIFSGGLAEDTIVGGYGEQDIEAGGTASGTTVEDGSQDIHSGGLADAATVSDFGSQNVQFGGTASGTIVGSAGYEYVDGTAIGTTISGGTLELHDGGSLGSGAVTFAGSDGTLQIDTASMPGNVIGGLAPTDVIDLTAVAFASGSVTLTSGNELQVSVNGSGYDLQVDPSQNFSGEYFQLLPDGEGHAEVALELAVVVSAGQPVSGASVAAGTAQIVYGSAISTTIGAEGVQIVESGGVASATTINGGGYEEVEVGGADSGATINYGGVQEVFGSANAVNVAYGGVQEVYGTAGVTSVTAGTQDVYGTASGTTVVEGSQIIHSGGLADAATVSDYGEQNVEFGGTASATSVGSAAYEDVYGTAIGTTISGGTLELYDGGSLGSGAVTFAGTNGTFDIDTSSMPGNVISGFAPTDVIDLAAVAFARGGGVTLTSGNELQVSVNGSSYDLQLDPSQNFTGEYFQLLPDGEGNTEVALALPVVVSAGDTVSDTLVSAGTVEIVYGTAISATAEGDGEQFISSGGVASVTTLNADGYQEVDFGGSAVSTTVGNNGEQYILSGGVASVTLVDGGGYEEVDFGGSAVATTVGGGGEQVVAAGGTASDGVISGGIQTVESGGVAIDTTVSSGGLEAVASGGTASGITIGSGGTAELASGAVVSAPITFANGDGTLEIDDTSSEFLSGVVLNGLGDNDVIDLPGVPFASGATASITSGGVLDVTVGGSSYDLPLGVPSDLSSDGVVVTSDGISGTDVDVYSDVPVINTLGTYELIPGVATVIPVSVSDPYAAATGELMTFELESISGSTVFTDTDDSNGTVTGQGTGDLVITGTVQQINADLSDPTWAQLVKFFTTPVWNMVFGPYGLFPQQTQKEIEPTPVPPTTPAPGPGSSGGGHAWLTTFDGLNYSFNAEGEFVLAESTIVGDTFQVQARFEPWSANDLTGTTITAIAAQVGSDTIQFDVNQAGLVLVNGSSSSLSPTNADLNFSGGQIIELSPTAYQVNWDTGESMTVTELFESTGGYLNFTLSLGPNDGPGKVQGLLGPDEGQASDFQLPDGTVLQQPLSTAELYGEFANAWRIPAGTQGLFDYPGGENTDNFTNVDFPYQTLALSDFPTGLVNQALALAAAAGITDPRQADDAALDYLVTGDPSFFTAHADVQLSNVTTTAAVVNASSPPPAGLGIAANSATVVETSGGTTPVTFEVFLTGGGSATSATVVDYSVVSGGSGYFGSSDFGGTFPTGSATIASGGTAAEFTIDVPAEALGSAPSETLGVQISATDATPVFATNAQTTVINYQAEPGPQAVPAISLLSGDASLTQNGTSYTLDLGTLVEGETTSVSLAIENTASLSADDLAGLIADGGTAPLTLSTTTLPLIAGLSYAGEYIVPGTTTVGTYSDTLTYTPEDLNFTGYSAQLAAQTLTVTYAVETTAAAAINSSNSISFGNVRVGDTVAEAVSISNTASAPAANLDASAQVETGGATVSGSITGLAPGGTDSSSINVGLDTSNAGVTIGGATINFYSDAGSGNTEFLSSQEIDVSGSVYRPGSASIPAIILHVGDPTSQTLTITNSDPNDGYSESLIATVVGTSGDVTATSGTTTGDIAPQATSTAISIGYSTASVGNAGTITLDLTTDGGTGSGSIDGLGTKDLGDQTYSVTVDNYAQAAFEVVSGGGTLTQNGDAFTLDLGNITAAGSALTLELGVLNSAVGPTDLLSGSFTISGDSAFSNTGLATFSGLDAGEADSALTVSVNVTNNGSFSETITLDPTDYNAGGYSSGQGPLTLTISGTVSGAFEVSFGQTSSGLVVSSGQVLDVRSGGTAIAATVASGGVEIVSAGGTDNGAQISGGEQDVYGLASAAMIFTGSQVVEAGGNASSTKISGGSEIVSVGGTDDRAQVSGGTQLVYGLANSATVFTGSQVVESGGTASGTTVSSGGTEVVGAGGTGSGVTISAGGTAELLSGAVAAAPIIFATSGATLDIGDTASAALAALNLSGLQTGDVIDLTNLTFSSGATASASISALVVSMGGSSFEIGLAGGNGAANDLLSLTSDGNTGTDIVVGASLGSAISAGNSPHKVSSGHTESDTRVLSGGSMFVLSGGVADFTSVSSGGFLTISHGGTASATTLTGTETVFGLDLAADVQSGGVEVVSSGATVSGATVSSGGTLKFAGGIAAADSFAVMSGATLELSSGLYGSSAIVSSGAIVNVLAGATLDIGNGAIASAATVGSGGKLIVSSGGSDIAATISSGGTASVASGGSDSFTVIVKGGIEIVSSGGVAVSATLSSGGTETVSAHGTDSGGEVSGGTQLVYGLASGAAVFSGAQVIESGGVASAAVLSGGSETISAHGTSFAAQISSGAQLVYGLASGGTIFAGAQVIETGGVASGTVISGGSEIVSAHGTDFRAQISSGGTQVVSGLTRGATVSGGGTQFIDSGGIASATVVLASGIEIVSAHGADFTANISGGEQDVYGSASGATIFTGSQVIESGGKATGTIVSGGIEIVTAHGSDSGAHIRGGTQVVDSGGTAVSAAVASGGSQLVSGGIASVTVVSSGGVVVVSAGGVAVGATISSGGTLIESGGLASNTVISNGGSLIASSGAIASNSTVDGGATLVVSSGGTADPTKILVGGSETISAGGTDKSAQISGGTQLDDGFAISATLFAGTQVVDSGGTAADTFVKSGGTDVIGAGGTVSGVTVSSGGVLELVSGGTVTGLSFSKGATIELVSGATPPFTLSAGGILALGAGQSLNGYTVSSGFTVEVLSGGTDISASVNSGGKLIVEAGGSDSGTTVLKGGAEIVSSGGVASATDILSGGTEIVSSGGSGIVVSSGSIAGAMTVSKGGVVEAIGTTIAQGHLSVLSGGTAELGLNAVAALTVSKGVVEIILSGGTGSGGAILAGGTGMLESGGQTFDTGNSSTNLNISSGGVFEFIDVDVNTTGAGSGIYAKAGAIVELLGGSLLSGQPISGFTGEVFAGSIVSALPVVAKGVLEIFFGGSGMGDVVSSGGTEIVSSGGVDSGAAVSSGGTEIVSSGGTAVGAIVSPGGHLIVLSGGSAIDTMVDSGGTAVVSAGGIVEAVGGAIGQAQLQTLSGGTAELGSGATGTLTISKGAVEIILSGGTANGGAILAGGTGILESGGTATSVNVNAGATFEYVDITDIGVSSAGGTVNIMSGATVELISGSVISASASAGGVSGGRTAKILAGGTAEGVAILSRGLLEVLSGGSTSGTVVNSNGAQIVSSGGFDSGANVSSGGTEVVSLGGTAAGAMVSSGGHLIVLSGGSAVDTTVDSAGSAVVSAGGVFDVATLAADSGSLTNAGTVNVAAGATWTLDTTTLSNSHAINFLGSDGSDATLQLDANLTLTGGGTVLLAGDGSNVIDPIDLPSVTLTNVNNTIIGAGEFTSAVSLVNSGTVNADNSGGETIEIDGTLINAGIAEGTSGGEISLDGGGTNRKTLEAATSGTLTIEGGILVNSGTMEALSGGHLILSGGTINNTAAAVISVGSGAFGEFQGGDVDSGTLRAAAGGRFVVEAGGVSLTSVSIAAGTLVEVSGGDELTLAGRTINSGTVTLDSGGTATISGILVNGGTGTLIASGSNSLVEVTAGAVVSGGSAITIGNGAVEVGSGGTAHVAFAAGDSGGLVLDGTGAIAVVVSGFGISGTSAHADTSETIDFSAIGSGASITYSAAANHTSGTLTVTSGGVSASITLVGSYTSVNFSPVSGVSTMEITDPAVVGGGNVVSTAPEIFPKDGLDLPGIAFGPQTTLAYAENGADTGGLLTVTNGAVAANIALLGNYIAASFATAGDGHGGTLVREAAQTQQQPLLSHPNTA